MPDIGKRFDVLFSRLMQRFDNVQFFGSHRVCSFVTWARAVDGKPIRIFAYSGSDGEVLANIGEQTKEEAKLKFANLSGISPSDANDEIYRIEEENSAAVDKLVASGLSRREALRKVRQNGRGGFPHETDVTDLAALWSVDPTVLDNQDRPLDLGLAVRLPESLKQ